MNPVNFQVGQQIYLIKDHKAGKLDDNYKGKLDDN